jgi:hypothetical protein
VSLLHELARLLCARMQFEDPIDMARRRLDEAGGMTAIPDPASVDRVERFRWDEVIAMLPPAAAAPALDIFGKLHLAKLARRTVRMRFSAATRFRLARLKAMAALRVSRPFSQRFKTERAWAERWLHMIDRSMSRQQNSVAEIIQTAELISGHGDAYQNGLAKWNVIVDGLIKPTCDGTLPLVTLGDAVREARMAALEGAGDEGVRKAVELMRSRCLQRA